MIATPRRRCYVLALPPLNAVASSVATRLRALSLPLRSFHDAIPRRERPRLGPRSTRCLARWHINKRLIHPHDPRRRHQALGIVHHQPVGHAARRDLDGDELGDSVAAWRLTPM